MMGETGKTTQPTTDFGAMSKRRVLGVLSTFQAIILSREAENEHGTYGLRTKAML